MLGLFKPKKDKPQEEKGKKDKKAKKWYDVEELCLVDEMEEEL